MNTNFSRGDIEISVSNHGAELQNLRFAEVEYLYQKQHGFWQRQSPILFPNIGKLREDAYEYKGRKYSLPQHGFLRDLDWEMVSSQNADNLAYRVSSSEETKERYPWDFQVDIRYVIENTTLRVEYTVTNTGNEDLPFSLGAHPAFHIDGPISEYSIRFDEDARNVEYSILDQEMKGLLSKEICTIHLKEGILPLTEKLFERDALIFRNLSSKKFTLLRNGREVFCFNRGNFPHFALWKQPHAPFFCFEPWQGFADSTDASGNILEKPGMIHLSGGESCSYLWEAVFPEK